MIKNKQRTCQICGKTYQPNSATQKYCQTCIPIVNSKRKKDWYVKNHPNAYAIKEQHRCCVCGGEFSSMFENKPYCNLHYQRLHHHGTTELQNRRNKYPRRVDGDVAYLMTKSGKEIMIDTDKLSLCGNITWCIDPRGYAVATIKGKHILMHRFLLGIDKQETVADHINGNRIDNRMENLRACSTSENTKNVKKKKTNSSGFPGIRKTPSGKFYVRITVDRNEVYIGTYDDFESALDARIGAERKYYGNFSPYDSRR